MASFVRFVQRLEEYLLAALLTVMIFLAFLQIVLRNVLSQGITWTDPLLRILVLWLALIGAVAASRGDRNIAIRAIAKILSPRLRLVSRVITSLFTVVVCGFVSWHGGRFVLMEYADKAMAFGKVPAWAAESIIPIGFALIALRYLAMVFIDLKTLGGLGSDQPDE